jgi:hypothetical protein
MHINYEKECIINDPNAPIHNETRYGNIRYHVAKSQLYAVAARMGHDVGIERGRNSS